VGVLLIATNGEVSWLSRCVGLGQWQHETWQICHNNERECRVQEDQIVLRWKWIGFLGCLVLLLHSTGLSFFVFHCSMGRLLDVCYWEASQLLAIRTQFSEGDDDGVHTLTGVRMAG